MCTQTPATPPERLWFGRLRQGGPIQKKPHETLRFVGLLELTSRWSVQTFARAVVIAARRALAVGVMHLAVTGRALAVGIVHLAVAGRALTVGFVHLAVLGAALVVAAVHLTIWAVAALVVAHVLTVLPAVAAHVLTVLSVVAVHVLAVLPAVAAHVLTLGLAALVLPLLLLIRGFVGCVSRQRGGQAVEQDGRRSSQGHMLPGEIACVHGFSLGKAVSQLRICLSLKGRKRGA